jgi:Clr5 domain
MAAPEKKLLLEEPDEEQTGSQCCSLIPGIDWEKVRRDVQKLYCEMNWPLKKVIDTVRAQHRTRLT